MKKFNLLCLFSALFFSCLSQDYNPGQEFNEKLKYSRMGLYFAPTVNFIQTNNSNIETNSNLGVVYGYALEMSLNQNHYLETGFSISYKGGDMTETISTEMTNPLSGAITTATTTTTNDYKVEYITIPIFVKMRSREVGYLHYFARIGPSMNFKIKDLITSEDKARRISLDLSIFLGAEYSLGGKTSIASSLFYTNNISNSINNKNKKALFHQLGIRLGFLF